MRLSADEARERFTTARTACLGMVDEHGRPQLVVVTFAVSGSVVVTAVDHKPKTTQELRRLALVEANPRVSMLADHYDDEDWTRLWWARADGVARVLRDPDDCTQPWAQLVAKYPQYAGRPPRGPVIRVEVTRWTGWSSAG